MLKRFSNLLRATFYLKGRTGSRKGGPEGAGIPLVDLNVRIVHAGGLVELYQDGVCAFEVMEKHPGMHISRPEIFKQPHESILHPYEKLIPGQKFYLVPITTVRKLKRRYSKKPQETSVDKWLEDTMLNTKFGNDHFEDSFFSAKEYFLSRCALWKCEREVKKPFTPPIKKPGLWKALEWQPSLPSIQEVSP